MKNDIESARQFWKSHIVHPDDIGDDWMEKALVAYASQFANVQVSDEEIEKEAKDFVREFTSPTLRQSIMGDFIKGAKWLRSKLENK